MIKSFKVLIRCSLKAVNYVHPVERPLVLFAALSQAKFFGGLFREWLLVLTVLNVDYVLM